MGVGIYSAYRFWLKRIFHFGFDIRYYGLENIVEEGPLIVASNHTSYLDPLPLGTTFNRPLAFMARKTLFDSMAAIPAATYRDALNCFTNPLERFDFARLTMPVLMMTGEHDRLAPPSEIRAVAGRIWDAAPRPDVRFEVIEGAGHVCNVERPDLYNRHLLTFLGRLP